MPIAANHVQFFKAQINNDTPDNGGLISTEVIADGVKNNIFPDASKNERLNGSTKYRKVFLGLRNPDNTAAIDVKLFVLRPTQAQDAVLMVETFKYHRQDWIEQNDRRYGAGILVNDSIAGATTLTVTPEQSVYDVYQVGDTLAVTTRNESNPTALVDYYVINAVAVSGTNKVITLNRGLDNAMPAGAVVSSCLFSSTLAASFSLNGVNGTFDATKVILNNAGSVDEDWGILFTSPTEFALGRGESIETPIATGSISADFSYINPATNQPYFTLPTTFFNGTYVAGNYFAFGTEGANLPVFLERIIPAGTDYAAGNSVLLAVELESA